MHGDATLLQVQRLLPPPPKHEWVAALETQHFVPCPSALAQQLVYFVLRQGSAAPASMKPAMRHLGDEKDAASRPLQMTAACR